jgi:hypothetical protein
MNANLMSESQFQHKQFSSGHKKPSLCIVQGCNIKRILLFILWLDLFNRCLSPKSLLFPLT